jgi:hypothetical protein
MLTPILLPNISFPVIRISELPLPEQKGISNYMSINPSWNQPDENGHTLVMYGYYQNWYNQIYMNPKFCNHC